MAGLNFSSSSDDITWVADALEQNLIPHKALIDVTHITSTNSGRGYVIHGEEKGKEICDFIWAKSGAGKLMTRIFAQPSLADDCFMTIVAQQAVKNCELLSGESKGTRWRLETIDGKQTLRCCLPGKGVKSSDTPPAGKPSQPLSK